MAIPGVQDAMLQQVLSFPPYPPPAQPPTDQQYDTSIQRVADALLTCPPARLTAPVSGNDTILDIVDPSINTLPYLFALLATARTQSATIGPNDPLYLQTVKFLERFDPVQIRYGGAQLRELLSMLLRGAGQNRQHFIASMRLMGGAILRLDPQGATMTSIHLMVLEFCLKMHDYNSPLILLDRDIYHLPPVRKQETTYPPYLCSKHSISAGYITEQSGLTNHLTYQDYLKYFLYGASVYIANKKWRRALHFLEIVLAAPVQGQSFSMIQAEAYKKWCLVHLLVHGRPGHPPRNMIQPVSKHCQSIAKPYVGVAEKFKDADPAKLRAEIEVGPFKADCNYGLVLFVVAAHRRLKVSKLSQTYSSLAVKDVLRLTKTATSTSEMAHYLQNLIEEGEIEARLSRPTDSTDPGDIILAFDVEYRAGQKPAEITKGQIEVAGKLAAAQQHMAGTRKRIELSKEYLSAARKQRKAEENAKAGKMHATNDDDDVFGEDL